MISEWTQSTVVKDGGKVEIVLPELPAGEHVEVTVRREPGKSNGAKRPGFGSMRGRIRMREDFDDPIDEFQDYL